MHVEFTRSGHGEQGSLGCRTHEPVRELGRRSADRIPRPDGCPAQGAAQQHPSGRELRRGEEHADQDRRQQGRHHDAGRRPHRSVRRRLRAW